MNQTDVQSLRQPKALYILFFVRMWECFSFYGMRALMVLYLIKEIGLGELQAYGVYAIYGSLVEFGGVLGGRLADKLLGLRKSIIWGGWLIALGHLCLSFQTTLWAFFSGLGLIVTGSGLFSTNISALLGLFYEENDPRRESGFTLFYVGINVGALLATIFCGVIGETYGWHYGFGLAALGMIIGNILFLSSLSLFKGKGEITQIQPEKGKRISYALLILAFPLSVVMIAWEGFFMQVMPCVSLLFILYFGRKMALSGKFSKQTLINLAIYLAALALFFAAEDLTASALLVFSERHTTETIAGIALPSTALLSLNPFVIILGGVLVSKFNFGKNTVSWLVVIGLILTAAVFMMLAIACYFPNKEGLVPLVVVAMAIIILSLGEVLIAPAIFSYFSEIAPNGWLGVTMGLIPVGFSMGNVISGFLSKSMAFSESASTAHLQIYANGFNDIALWLSGMACLILVEKFIISKFFKSYAKI